MTAEGGPPLMSPRSALIFVVAFIAALIAGLLAHLSGSSLPAAVLYGGGAFGAALFAANSMIGF